MRGLYGFCLPQQIERNDMPRHREERHISYFRIYPVANGFKVITEDNFTGSSDEVVFNKIEDVFTFLMNNVEHPETRGDLKLESE